MDFCGNVMKAYNQVRVIPKLSQCNPYNLWIMYVINELKRNSTQTYPQSHLHEWEAYGKDLQYCQGKEYVCSKSMLGLYHDDSLHTTFDQSQARVMEHSTNSKLWYAFFIDAVLFTYTTACSYCNLYGISSWFTNRLQM